MKSIINLMQKIDAKHLFFAGGISAISGLTAAELSGGSLAIWLLFICVVSALIFFALIAIKVAYSLLNTIVTAVKRPRTRSASKSNRNIPLVIVGLITLIAISSLRAQLGGGVAVSIVQACALVMVLYGFGMSWTRKGSKTKKKQATRTVAEPVDSNELIKVWRDILDGKSHSWKPLVAAIVHISNVPDDVIEVAEKTNGFNGSGTNKFPRQLNGYDGVLWIARENTTYEPNHMLIFSPVFDDITDKKWWENTPLMLCPDIESWLELKEATVNTLIIDDNIKVTPLTTDKDFSVLTALLKTKHYKDIK